MKPKTPAKNLDQYIVRFPDGMRDKLKQAAEDNNRSLNAEIVSRLEQSFESSGALTPEERASLSRMIREAIDAAAADVIAKTPPQAVDQMTKDTLAKLPKLK